VVFKVPKLFAKDVLDFQIIYFCWATVLATFLKKLGNFFDNLMITMAEGNIKLKHWILWPVQNVQSFAF